MNIAIITGNLGQDPELRHTQSGTAVMSLRIATTERIKKNDEWTDHSEWHTAVVWGRRAESLANILRKGAKVGVRGRLQTRSWEDSTGNKRYSTEINADDIELLGSKPGGNTQGHSAPSDDMGEIPF